VNISINQGLRQHAEQIAALHAASWVATYSDVLSPLYLQNTVPTERLALWKSRFETPKSNQLVLVAQEGSAVIGFAFACVFVGEHPQWGSCLDNLHVQSSHQGQGVGRSLLRCVAALCEIKIPDQGLYLNVNQSNTRAQMLYLAWGGLTTRKPRCGMRPMVPVFLLFDFLGPMHKLQPWVISKNSRCHQIAKTALCQMFE
jgi:ribosomal protein S18 acetylase RimI-like enzyme